MKLILRTIEVTRGTAVQLSILWMDSRFLATSQCNRDFLPEARPDTPTFTVCSRFGSSPWIDRHYGSINLSGGVKGSLGIIDKVNLDPVVYALQKWSAEFNWEGVEHCPSNPELFLNPDSVPEEEWRLYGIEDWGINHPAFKVTWLQSEVGGTLQINHVSVGLLDWLRSGRDSVLQSVDCPEVSGTGTLFVWGRQQYRDYELIPNHMSIAASKVLRDKILRFLAQFEHRVSSENLETPIRPMAYSAEGWQPNSLSTDNYKLIVV